MILHCVFCDFRAETTASQQTKVLSDLAHFSEGLEGVLDFEFGPNLDFEGKSELYDAGFVIRFTDQAAAQLYASHPTHQKLGAQLCELCDGGADGIKVFDLEI